MNQPTTDPTSSPVPGKKQLKGPVIVLIGAVIIISITAFVISRVIDSRQPTPDPDSIPERPTGDSG